jgi:hypothetical protein
MDNKIKDNSTGGDAKPTRGGEKEISVEVTVNFQ